MLKNVSNLVQSFPYSYAFSILLLGSLIMFEISIVTCTCLNCTFYKQKGDSVYVIKGGVVFKHIFSFLAFVISCYFYQFAHSRVFLSFQCLKFLFMV